MSVTLGSLCSGYGGLELAGSSLLDMRLLWVSDIEPAARRVLGMRFPDTPNIGDLRLATPEPVDVLTAGFPCQPVSHAGKRAGTDDVRWLWDDIQAFVGRMDPRPRLLLLENVAGLLSANDGNAMARVVHGLADLGYMGSWRVVRASDIGAPHQRARVFIVAHTQGFGWERDGITRRRWTGLEDGGGDAAAVTGSKRHRVQEPQTADESGGGTHPRFAAVVRPGDRSADAEGALAGGRSAPHADVGSRPEPHVGTPGGQPTPRRDHVAGLGVQWGVYEPAIRRWERTLGRPAPPPTTAHAAQSPNGRSPERRGTEQRTAVGRDSGTDRLNPAFVEWMMGLPEGWVTDTGIPRTAQLRVLGNGVVPQQAAYAYRMLLNAII